MPNAATTVTPGNLCAPHTLLALFGLLQWQPQAYRLCDIAGTAF